MQHSLSNEQTTGAYAGNVIFAVGATPLAKPKSLNIKKDSQLSVETGTPNELHREESLACASFIPKPQ
eukprot:11032658-Karenia_brevis.AAC.1